MPEFSCKILEHSLVITDLEITSEERGPSGLSHHGDLLEGQEVVNMDVILWRETPPFPKEKHNQCH